MKPHVIMHMGISIDGRIVPSAWPKALSASMGDVYEDIHRKLDGDAWIVGRVTMAEFGKGDPNPAAPDQAYPRTTWKAPGVDKGPYAIAIDGSGKLHLNTAHANGDPIVLAVTEKVSDAYLAQLRRDGISYFFAGQTKLDFQLLVQRLWDEFGIRRLLLEGGGDINASFLREGLVDEVSLLVAPVADAGDGPSVFASGAAVGAPLKLFSVDRLDDDFLHLRYEVTK